MDLLHLYFPCFPKPKPNVNFSISWAPFNISSRTIMSLYATLYIQRKVIINLTHLKVLFMWLL